MEILQGVKPRFAPSNAYFKDYFLSWETVKELPYLKDWIMRRTSQERASYQSYSFYARVHFNNKTQVIQDIAVSARQGDFVHMEFSDIKLIINAIKRDNMAQGVAI